jgi:hypothetical protein
LEFLHFTQKKAAALYRFALLLNGNPGAAAEAMSAVVEESAPQLLELRNEKNSLVFILKKIREKSLKHSGVSAPASTEPDDEPLLRAAQFATLPEPERSALALAYLDFLPASEAAGLLGMDLGGFSDTLGKARQLLWKAQSGPANAG